jgi:copper transport protein
MNRRLVLLFLLSAFAAVLLAGSAAGHAQYVSSSPAACAILPSAPSQVTVTLSEAVESGSGSIQVTDQSGARVDAPPVNQSGDGRTLSVALAPSGPGVYEVKWTAVSAVDGHFTRSSFSYEVQRVDEAPQPCDLPTETGATVSPLEVALRFLGFLGVAIVLGVGVLANFMWLPAGRDPDVRASRAYGLGFPVLLNVGRIAAFAFAASMVGLFAIATGLEGTSAAQGLLASPYVQSVATRIALAGILFVLLSHAFATSRSETPERSTWTLQASIGVALTAILAGSVATHAAATPTVFATAGIAADATHLAGVGLWVGGLAGIVAVRGFLREPDGAPLARIVLGRFSRLAGYAVGLVLAGGVTLSLLLVGSWDALLGTSYGWVVLGKVALFTPMIALGAFNRYRLIPKTAEATPVTAVRRLVANVRFETGLGVAVLILAGLLTSMTPAASLAPGPPGLFVREVTVDDLRLRLQVDPYPTTPGEYTITVLLFNATTGEQYKASEHGTRGNISFALGGADPTTEVLDGPHPPNHFLVVTSALSEPGNWRIDTAFTRVDGPEVRATFHITIRASG